ncbi:MAG: error-prone DNA polymerase, partial [Gammaproteobacteria bacterium]|nr:error-prone DNA polymerase [Gammaproteobacteria bacterium]
LDRASLFSTVNTYRSRSSLRDVGKALGIPAERLSALTGNLHWWDGRRILPDRLLEVGFDPETPRNRRLLELATTLIGFPRHLSQHTGGMVISDPPLTALVPIENAAMPERTVMQWDKDDVEALGLLKIDCLCLGMLSALRRALALLSELDGRRWDLADIPAEDPATYAMIQRADTVGIFQIESRAQMAMLPRLKPAHYYDLVIEIAIIRPGPIQGEMVHPYLRRRNGEEPVIYPSPELREVLARTLGVPLFQEQVIKLAMVAAGFSPGEADQLRRAMATWQRDGAIDRFRDRFIGGMRARGYAADFAARVFAQIQGFGEYGFPESHAASFALLAYASAWLKRHRPAAFTAALLNSQPMGFYAPSQLVQDARRHDVEVRPIDVQHSFWDCTLEPMVAGRHPALRLGLRLLSGLSRAAADRIVVARAERSFATVIEFATRARLDRGELRILSGGGALRDLHPDRHRAVWAALGAGAALAGERAAVRRGRVAGVAEPAAQFVCPLPEPEEATPLLRPSSEGEDIVADYTHAGLSLERHPLALLRRRLDRLGFIPAARLREVVHGRLIRTGGIVVTRQRPGTASGVVFVTLEDETGVINLIVHARLVEAQRRELLDARLLGVVGRVQREGEVLHVIANRLGDHTALLGRLAVSSRDFH